MKVIVLGAGAIGSVIAELLTKEEAIEEVVVADLTRERAQNVAGKIGSPRVRALALNADNVEEMKVGLKGMDLVINAVLPRFFLKIMKAALESGTNYLDMATDLAVAAPEMPGDKIAKVPIDLQLEQDDEWRKAGLSAMLCWGNDPGACNVYARYAADGMDSVEKILVRDGDSGYVEGFDGFAALWSPDTLIEEVALMNALVWTEGHFERVPSLGVSEVFEFPPPLGKMRVWAVDHEEPETLGRTIGKGCKECNFMIALGEETAELLGVLRKLGMVRPDPIDVKGVKVCPRDVVTALMPSPNDPDIQKNVRGAAVVGTVVVGEKKGKKISHYVYQSADHAECYRKHGITAVAWQTATPAAVAAIMLARGEITRKGVYTPEMLDPQPILERFSDFGFKWGEEIREL